MAYEGEGGVTRLRREFKLLLSAEAAQALCARLEAQAGPAEGLPPATLITSVYFDWPGLALTTRARQTPGDCVKVRTKEYFPDFECPSGRRVVLEVKRERGGLTHKRRLWMERPALAEALGSGAGHIPRIVDGELQAQLAVTYRRRVFQCVESWRVTLDDQIAFHRVTQAQALSHEPLTRERLEAPFELEPQVVLEVKHRGAVLPVWLAALERQCVECFSKFGEGMRRLQQERQGAAGQGS